MPVVVFCSIRRLQQRFKFGGHRGLRGDAEVPGPVRRSRAAERERRGTFRSAEDTYRRAYGTSQRISMRHGVDEACRHVYMCMLSPRREHSSQIRQLQVQEEAWRRAIVTGAGNRIPAFMFKALRMSPAETLEAYCAVANEPTEVPTPEVHTHPHNTDCATHTHMAGASAPGHFAS